MNLSSASLRVTRPLSKKMMALAPSIRALMNRSCESKSMSTTLPCISYPLKSPNSPLPP